MYPPPAIHPSELRPGRGWYGFAVVFVIVMIVLGDHRRPLISERCPPRY